MASWSEDDLRAAWATVASEVPEPFELSGVTFHGSEDPPRWVAFVYSEDLRQFAEEGVGSSPIDALLDLRDALRLARDRGPA